MAAARHQPAEAPATLTGRQETVKPVAAGSAPRLWSFSIWQYSRSIPARWASHRIEASPVFSNSARSASNGRSRPHASVPITFTPCSSSHVVDARVRPEPALKYSAVSQARSAPVHSSTMS